MKLPAWMVKALANVPNTVQRLREWADIDEEIAANLALRVQADKAHAEECRKLKIALMAIQDRCPHPAWETLDSSVYGGHCRRCELCGRELNMEPGGYDG